MWRRLPNGVWILILRTNGKTHSWVGRARNLNILLKLVFNLWSINFIRDDPMQGLQLKFNTKDEAVLFAENQGRDEITLKTLSNLLFNRMECKGR